jgi:hypothetical protein
MKYYILACLPVYIGFTLNPFLSGFDPNLNLELLPKFKNLDT